MPTMTIDPAHKVLDGVHHPYVEELLAHLTADHRCSRAQDYVQVVLNREVEARARRTPDRADGTKVVQLDTAKEIEGREHRAVLEALHEQHYHASDALRSSEPVEGRSYWRNEPGHGYLDLDPHQRVEGVAHAEG